MNKSLWIHRIFYSGIYWILAWFLVSPFISSWAQSDSPSAILLASNLIGGKEWEAIHAIENGEDGWLYVVGDTPSSDFPLQASNARSFPQDIDGFLAVYDSPGDPRISMLIGGNSSDSITGLAIENDIVYIAGTTTSTDFPIGTSPKGEEDIFVLAYEIAQDRVIYAIRLGGSDQDILQAIAVEGGNVYLTGMTWSKDFPASNYHGQGDVFGMKVDPAGAVSYAVLVGGKAEDVGLDITVREGEAIITGQTWSSDLPGVELQGEDDVFVTRLDVGGQVKFLTLVGGKDEDSAQAIALDSDGRIYLAGWTKSNDFPAGFSQFSGESDAFLAWLEPDGQFSGARFLGGSRSDEASDIDIDDDGNIYICGQTASVNFPVTDGAIQENLNGSGDAFLTLTSVDNLTQQGWDYSSYLGGDVEDRCITVAIGKNGDITLAGVTSSENFPRPPTADALKINGNQDGFIAWLRLTGIPPADPKITPVPSPTDQSNPPQSAASPPTALPTDTSNQDAIPALSATLTEQPAPVLQDTQVQPDVMSQSGTPTSEPQGDLTPTVETFTSLKENNLRLSPSPAIVNTPAETSKQPARGSLSVIVIASLAVIVTLVGGWIFLKKRNT
jgi:hypothetical protein